MRHFFSRARWLVCLAVGCLCLATSTSRADDAFLPFLDGLYERGWGELAVEYLKEQGARTDLPAEFKEVLDLEMSTALRVAAAETLNADESAARLADAQKYLEKFLKEHPDHPRAAAAYVAFGDLSSERGDKLLALALKAKGKTPSPLFLDARKDFDEARPKYEKAVEMYRAQFAAAVDEEKKAAEAAAEKPVRRSTRAKRSNAPTKVEIAESLLLGARFKLGGADYKLGRTYTDKKDPKRKAAFQAAMKEFDSIYQYNRQLRVGLYAHLYHGRAADALGDELLALDIYDEVLANAPADGNTKIEPEWENLFAEVERSRLEIKLAEAQLLEVGNKQSDADIKRDEIITEAEEWIRLYYRTQPQQRSTAYQSIAVLAAETALERAQKASADEAKRLKSLAKQLLTKASEIPGPYMQEAILAKLELGGEDAVPTDIKGALAVGDKAAGEAKWDEAIKNYQAALQMANASKQAGDKKFIPITRMALARAELFGGKVAESFETFDLLARDPATDAKMAPVAAAMAVDAALSLYIGSTPDNRQVALDRLLKATDYTVKTWPQLSQADEARLALGKVNLAQNKPDEAIKVFEAVNPASELYPSAMYWGGMVRWMLYLNQRQSPKADQAALASERQKIVQELATSVEGAKNLEAAGKPPIKDLPDAMLLLAEVYNDGGEAPKAVPLLDPIIAKMQKNKPKTFDKFTLRACTDAVRAYIAANEMTKAEGVATLMMTVGEDVPNVNNVLLKFASTVKNNWRQAEGALIEHKGDAKTEKAAKANAAANKQLLTKIIDAMASRTHLGVAGTVLLGDTAFELGLNDKAGKLYQFVIDHENDQDFVGNTPNVKGAIDRCRSRLIGIKRAEKKYAEALADVDKLIKDNPRALEPRMERGRILQGWSEEEPKHFPEAVAQWTELRRMLTGRRSGKKPPEYYEVIYNAAACLVEEARQTKDTADRTTKAGQAGALLKSTRTLSPKLGGNPDMVAKYEVLLKEAEKLAGPPQAANR